MSRPYKIPLHWEDGGHIVGSFDIRNPVHGGLIQIASPRLKVVYRGTQRITSPETTHRHLYLQPFIEVTPPGNRRAKFLWRCGPQDHGGDRAWFVTEEEAAQFIVQHNLQIVDLDMLKLKILEEARYRIRVNRGELVPTEVLLAEIPGCCQTIRQQIRSSHKDHMRELKKEFPLIRAHEFRALESKRFLRRIKWFLRIVKSLLQRVRELRQDPSWRNGAHKSPDKRDLTFLPGAQSSTRINKRDSVESPGKS